MGNGRHVFDEIHFETCSLQRTNGRLAARLPAPLIHLDLTDAVIHGSPCRSLGGHSGGKGRPLSGALKPLISEEDQERTLPCLSVIVTIVLLKVERICAMPEGMFFLSRRRSRVPFLAWPSFQPP